MPSTVSGGFVTALQQTTTQLARLYRVTRLDGVEDFLTSSDQSIRYDPGDGEQTWSPISGFSMSAVETSSTMSVDNATIQAFFNQGAAIEDDIRAGKFDGATIKIYMVHRDNLALGDLQFVRGTVGNVRPTNKGVYEVEYRGFLQKYRQTVTELFGPLCRDNLGGPRCRIPIMPSLVTPNTAYDLPVDLVADNPLEDGRNLNPAWVLALDLNLTALTVTNGDAESGTTGWTNEVGTLTTDTTPTPNGGTNLFKGTDTDTQTKAYQDVAIPGGETTAVDNGERAVRVTWWQQSTGAGDDQAQITVRFFDGAPGSQIGAEVSTGLADGGIGSWTQFSASFDIPTLTRTLRIAMDMEGNGVSADAFIDDVSADLVEASTQPVNYQDRVYEVTTAGTTDAEQPAFDTVVGNTTSWGTAVFTAREGWLRAVTVDSVDGTEPSRKFTVTELTPNTGGTIAGRDSFPDDSMNGGAVMWITGFNAGLVMEIKDFVADDGITIEQDVEMFLGMPFAVTVGDTAVVWRGCNGTQSICSGTFSNINNFRGEPYIPGRDFLLTFPDARS